MQARKEPPAVPAPTQPVSARTLEVLAAQNDSRNVQAAVIDKNGKADSKDLEEIVNKNLNAQVASNNSGLEAIVDKGLSEPAPVVPQTLAKPPAPTPVTAPPRPKPPAPVALAPAPSPVVAPVTALSTAAVVATHAAEAAEPKVEIPEEEAKGFGAVLTKVRVFAIRWREVLDIIFVGSIMIFTGLLYRVSQNQNFILARSVKAAEESARAAQRSANIAEGLYRKLEKTDVSQATLDL